MHATVSAATTARDVDWRTVREYILPVLDRVGSWPLAGSVEWLHLAADDPRKIAALFDAAQHHALRVDTAQAARAAASHDVAAAADWSAVAHSVHRNEAARSSSAYIPRKAS